MFPKDVNSILAVGEDMDAVLFRIAISTAENGQHVWIISPKTFDIAPKNLKPPDKEVLQLITFLYLKNYKDLAIHLNSIHMWRNIPTLIIATSFETYYNFASPEYNSVQAASITTCLLDSSAVCAKKSNQTVNVLVICSEPCETDRAKLQVLKDLYFNNYVHKTDNEEFYNQIMSLFKLNIL